jgi:SP family general alpha glucoside:H+ symporter-like MFS transporter
MQSILKQITKAGQLVGLAFTGTMLDKLGYKWTMIVSLAALAPVILMQFLAPNINVMIGAQFLIGVPLAPFLTLSNVRPLERVWRRFMADNKVYAAEVAPVCLQPYLTSATSFAWSLGGLISTGALRGLLSAPAYWS